jgi:hypothetical protein
MASDAGTGMIPTDPDRYWLDEIGTGIEQRMKVCASGARDPIAVALCNDSDEPIDSLAKLYSILNLDGSIPRTIALGTNSSGLGARIVSAANPRIFVLGTDEAHYALTVDRLVVTSFVRGEQKVEMAGYDPVRDRINFYLLIFEQDCNRSRCGPKDLLSEKIESGWRDWTVYDAESLQDTPLDCLSCHRPDGPTGQTRFLMRDLQEPWFHWMPTLQNSNRCGLDTQPKHVPPDLRAVFENTHRSEMTYGGISFQDSSLRESTGHNLFALLSTTGHFLGGSDRTEPFQLPSAKVVSQWQCEARTTSWNEYRAPMRERGFPVPYYGFNNLDAAMETKIQSDFGAVLDEHSLDDAFELMASVLSNESRQASGVEPPPDADGKQILHEMCVRCHGDDAPTGSRRALFNVHRLTKRSAGVALERIDAPSDSPFAMPPRQAGHLPEAARAILRAYLRE